MNLPWMFIVGGVFGAVRGGEREVLFCYLGPRHNDTPVPAAQESFAPRLYRILANAKPDLLKLGGKNPWSRLSCVFVDNCGVAGCALAPRELQTAHLLE